MMGIGRVHFMLAVSAYGIVVSYWYTKVANTIPEPYLDEVFHVRQAQAYLARQWGVWDPKITTPPGLYLLSVFADYIRSLITPISGFHLGGSPTAQLRIINLLAATFVLPHSMRALCTPLWNQNGAPDEGVGAQRARNSKSTHSKTNLVSHGYTAINICLFPPLFFFYALYYTDVWSLVFVLQTLRASFPWFWGIAALLFRQTNVFWVAIFPAALEVVRTLKRKGSPTREGRASFAVIAERSWKESEVYDPTVSEAGLEDYFKVCLSVGIAAIANIQQVIQALLPYLVPLGVFLVFIIWNGGVVLGDKSNHIATIHLPQMLYIWPYILFFSFPLLYPYILNAFLPQHCIPFHLRHGSLSDRLPRLSVTIPILSLMLATINFNTIIHPFTLADNRHYVFYVFRILRQHPAIPYLAAPVYFVFAWAAITALGGMPAEPQSAMSESQSSESSTSKSKQEQAVLAGDTNRVSFVVIWLLTTALSLITAPLVEPRYLILPWVIWRINLPMQRQKASEVRLWLETVWFLIVNFITGYIFLYWDFEWVQEPGKVQRFMW